MDLSCVLEKLQNYVNEGHEVSHTKSQIILHFMPIDSMSTDSVNR